MALVRATVNLPADGPKAQPFMAGEVRQVDTSDPEMVALLRAGYLVEVDENGRGQNPRVLPAKSAEVRTDSSSKSPRRNVKPKSG